MGEEGHGMETAEGKGGVDGRLQAGRYVVEHYIEAYVGEKEPKGERRATRGEARDAWLDKCSHMRNCSDLIL